MSNDCPLAEARPTQPGVLSRLQGWHLASPPPKAVTPVKSSIQSVPPQQARFLKVKIVSWNMHDSLPKGDLEQLLGRVPSYQPSNSSGNRFPILSGDENHPYHLVVIAGQECPTLSGIPMGLSAGFKRHDRDREKDKGKEAEKAEGRGKEPPGVERSKSRRDKEEFKRRKDEDVLQEPSGWTAMCEDWLCHGGGLGLRNGSPTVADVSSPKPLMRRVPSKDSRRGPYQLLTKERLMGIYLAVYIHRDIQDLVKGTSKSAVTAGLIGGRVGNKGGVGISINLDGTTLLFLNAHLTAHGNKLNHRLSNLLKIKTELAVDSYLRHDDPRMMTEDLTDKFDFTFICGDLNFRLDITRLHADWLITQKDYAQALHFDQLRKLMKEGKAFVGFEEGLINFPPTFKYDVSRALKKPRNSASRQSPQTGSPVFTSQEFLAQGKAEEGHDVDVISIASTLSSSLNFGGEQGETIGIAIEMPAAAHTKRNPSKASQKARKRWLSLLSTRLSPYRSKASPQAPLMNNFRKSLEEMQRLNKPKPPTPVQRHSLDTGGNHNLQPPAILVNSTKTSLQSENQLPDPSKGVYDSSHKQRVPSWCDRILWKSTLVPDVEEEELNGDMSGRSKSGFIQRLTRKLRSRSGSQTSVARVAPTSSKKASSRSAVNRVSKLPSSRIIQPPDSATLVHSHSHENLLFQPSSWGPRKRKSEGRLRRATSPTPGIPSTPLPQEELPRRATENQAPRRTSSRDSFWRFFSFLSPSHSPETSPRSSAVDLVAQASSQPRKGDVICISYGTLDDHSMERLEGRSDHRPVVGSYALYF